MADPIASAPMEASAYGPILFKITGTSGSVYDVSDVDKRVFIRNIWALFYGIINSVVGADSRDLITQTTISAEILNIVKAYRQSKLGEGNTYKSVRFFGGPTGDSENISITLHDGTSVFIDKKFRQDSKDILSKAEEHYPSVPSPVKTVNGAEVEVNFRQGFIGDLIKFCALAHSIKGNIIDMRFVSNARRRTNIVTDRKVSTESITRWGASNNQVQLFKGLNWTTQMKSSNTQALGIGTCLVEYNSSSQAYRRNWQQCIRWKLGAWPFFGVIDSKIGDMREIDTRDIAAILQYAAVVGTRDRRRYSYPPEFLFQMIKNGKCDFTFSNIETLKDYNIWASGIGLQPTISWLWTLCVSGCLYDDGAVIQAVTGGFQNREDCREAIKMLCRAKKQNGLYYTVHDLVGSTSPVIKRATNLSSAQYMSERSGSSQGARNAFMSGYCRTNLEAIIKTVTEDTRAYGNNLADIVSKELEILQKKKVIKRGNMTWHAWSGSSFIPETDLIIDESGKLFFGGDS